MNYNKSEILKMIRDAKYLNPNHDFYERDNYDFTNAMGEAFSKNYIYAHGATKLVLIPIDEKKDYVVKIPYTGTGEYISGWYSSDNYYHRSYEEYYPFQNAEGDLYEWDYCANEEIRYEIAEENGFACCFARTKLIGYTNEYPIYIQERCQTFEELRYKHEHSNLEKEHTKSLCGKWFYMNLDWLTDFKLYYGEGMMLQFIKFLHDNRWDDDLRNENIGYIGDRPVLIDYSSFLD